MTQWQPEYPQERRQGPPAVPPQFQQNPSWEQPTHTQAQYRPQPYGQPQYLPQVYQQPPSHPAYRPAPYGYQHPRHAPAVTPKSTGTGLLLGLLFPGVGCMYAGRAGIGIGILAAWLISIPLVFVFGIGFLTGLAAWILSAVLGYTFTRDWNTARGIAS